MRRFYTQGLELVELTSGLEIPWSMAFLPDGSMLVTERVGRLRHIDSEGLLSGPISGLPLIAQGGEGGLLGIAIAPDFSQSRRVFWSYSEPAASGQQGTSSAVASSPTGRYFHVQRAAVCLPVCVASP
ncbi:PQQ-dependent sugar dehydrogenase [Granulosicoccus antarcticus]|nr:PQQ-dependent sugar dehydrogenase [Granulosicoccus antarcticus]